MAAGRVKVVRADDVEPMTWGGQEAGRWLLRGEDTGGVFSLCEVSLPAGQGSPFHLHQEMDEVFYVLDGELEVTVGGETHRATAGVLVYAPRAVGHSFRNPGDRPCRFLSATTPGGVEDFFEELSRMTSGGPPPHLDRLRELAAEHRIVTLCGPGGDTPAGPGAHTARKAYP